MRARQRASNPSSTCELENEPSKLDELEQLLMSIGEESSQPDDSGWRDPEHDRRDDALEEDHEGSSLGTILRELLSDRRSGVETAEESGEDDEIVPIGPETPRMANLRERLNELRIGRVSPLVRGR